MTAQREDVQADPAELPLAGVRVLDLAQGISGPYAAKWLGALGADVIKVEPPAGDSARSFGPWPNDDPDDESSGLFLYLNTNKRGITLNLETSDGREILRELANSADIVIESCAPRYLDGLGIGYDVLRKDRPSLVMISITPFGQTGPYADLPATELTLWALSGQMWLTGDPNRPPLKSGGSQPSYEAGLQAFNAALTAYYGALMQGEGTHVDLSVQETLASMLELYANHAAQTGEQVWRRRGNALSAVWGIYPCADGFAGLCCLPRNYARMTDALAIPELKEPPFNDPVSRLENDDALQAIMYGWFGDRTRLEVFDLGLKFRFPAGYVATVEDLANSEHLNGRGFFQEDDHPRAGRLKFPRQLWISDEHRWRDGRAPELGEHNLEILQGELGYEKDDLVRLRELEAI